MQRLVTRLAVPLGAILLPEPRFVGFAVRTTIAALLALFIAYRLEIESPSWAATTVFIVAQPVRGMVLAKSFYRVIGTTIGAAVAVAMIALFGQAPELFVAALALWVAVCTYIYTILRYFRAYAAVLAGYTAALVGLAAAAAPNSVFDIAVARATAVVLGITCSAVLTGLLAPGSAKQDLIDRLNRAVADAARWTSLVILGEGGAANRAMQHRLITDIMRFEELAGYAAAEAPELRGRMAQLHATIVALLSVLSAGNAIDAHLRHRDTSGTARAALAPLLERAAMLLLDAGRELTGNRASELLGGIAALRCTLETISAETVSERLVIDRLDDALEALAAALDGIAALAAQRRDSATAVRIAVHHDWRGAFVNAIRTALGIAAAGTFWIVSAWPNGATMLIIVTVMVSLFATRDNPAAAGWTFLVGTLLAAFVAFPVDFLVLPQLDGFPLLAAALAPFMIVGALLAANPATAGLGAAFNVYFLALIAPTNPMVYDAAAFLNGAVATLVGMGIGVVVFWLVLPVDRAATVRRLVTDIARDLRFLAESPSLPAQTAWESRMYDRVALLLPGAGEAQQDYGLAALRIGLEIIRLRSALASGALPRPALRRVRVALARLARDLPNGAAPARDAAERLAAVEPAAPIAVQRVRAGLAEIADTLSENRALFATEAR